MKRLALYLKPYWAAVLLAPLLMLVEVVCDLLQPTLMSRIVNIGVGSGDAGYIIKTGTLMLGIALLGMAGGIGCTIFAVIASQNFGTDLRADLFQKIQSFSFANLDKLKTESLITRLTNDVMQVQHVVLMMLRILVRAPLLFVGGIVMAVAINPVLACISLAVIPVMIGILAFVITKSFPLFAAVQEKLDRVNRVMRENLTGVRVVKAFVRSDYEISRFGKANDELMEITVKASRFVGMTMPIIMLLMNTGVVAVTWLGGYRVNSGNIQVGHVIALINYIMQILFALMMSTMMLMSATRAKASADRIIEVLDMELDIGNDSEACRNVVKAGRVEFKHVSFRYEGTSGADVLQDVSFTANPGETIAILGATGAGKSTLINLIPRFYDATEGRILIDGVDVRDMEPQYLRSIISVVLQESILFSGTIRDNIRWGRKDATEEEVVEAAKAAQAHDFIMGFPHGYDTVLGQRGVNLSGGQKQRLSIARALLKKPLILIMDDSTSAVDLETESRIQASLKELMKNTTCFIIAQRINSVVEADKIIVLENGRVADIGSHGDLMRSSRVYQEIYRSQTGEEAV
ncbi:MAG: ATP-binding cassette, subfamily multidrug efflux pump [Clostridiales bacterium]|jgi:ATP-binding cassette subfamily B protein|nr:multidrug transporter ATP-binding protein [Clostridia bacterium]MDK2932670.1 ATP-binding cassette, subfamily multidrug efflux pump [Clostridiales bacterium]